MFKRLLGRFSAGYRKMSIQTVISLSFTVIAVVGMVFMGVALFLRFSTISTQTMQENSSQLLAQVNINLDNYLRRMMRVSDTMYYRSIKSTDFARDNVLDHMALMYEENRDAVVSIALFDSGGGLISATPLTSLKSGANAPQQGWFISATQKIENLHFSSPHVQNLFDDPDYNYRWVVSLSRQVELTHSGVTYSGVLLVDMSFAGIEQICREAAMSGGGYIYLIDGNGEIIYHPQQQLIYAGLAQENSLAAASYPDGSLQENFMGENRQITVKTVGYTGWKLVAVAPSDTLQSNAQQIWLFGVFLLLFSIFLMAHLNFRISAYISDPIRRLEQSVKELENGRRDMETVEGGSYEVERLSHSIRSMVSTMHHLMDDIIQQEEQKRRSELEVLQSQINPHFLYNTLDSVIWMTEAGQYDESIQMVTSLGRLFRISLSKGKSIIPLADELEHARHYMAIQEIRYKKRFTTNITADENVAGCYCLKLIVQPILENSIYHGLPAGVDEGIISVHASMQGEDVVIDVEDNGIGMPPELVQCLLEEHRPQMPPTKGSGIGVRNVHQRIRLSFGEGYGLEIKSEPDVGTRVRIRLPRITNPEKQEIST